MKLNTLKPHTSNQICVQAISQCKCIGALRNAMKVRPDVQALVCETLMHLMKSSDDDLIAQVSCCCCCCCLEVTGSTEVNRVM